MAKKKTEVTEEKLLNATTRLQNYVFSLSFDDVKKLKNMKIIERKLTMILEQLVFLQEHTK